MGFTYTLRNAYGDSLVLDDPYIVQGVDGMGLPEPEFFTSHGPYQNGETVENQRWRARILTIGVDMAGTDDTTYQAARRALASILRAIHEPMYFVLTLADGTERYLDVRYAGQLSMPTKSSAGVYRTSTAVPLIAHQPMWYNPAGTVWSFALGSGEGVWGFPLPFPEGFGASTLDVTVTRQYVGTEPVFPRVIIYGPCKDFLLENLTTGEKLDLTGTTVAGGEIVTVDLRYGRKSVASVGGTTDLADFLANDSDFTWHLAPHPEAPDGQNTLHMSMVDGDTNTKAEIRFNARYSAF